MATGLSCRLITLRAWGGAVSFACWWPTTFVIKSISTLCLNVHKIKPKLESKRGPKRQNAIKFRQLLYVLRVLFPSPSLSLSYSLCVCVLMCFFDDKADLCPIGFAAKSHNSCFYDRMPIKALNVANCRRFFNKYKMCQAQWQRHRPKKR